MKKFLWLLPVTAVFLISPTDWGLHSPWYRLTAGATEPRSEPHRSPVDVAVLPDGRRALTANHTSDSVSLIDLAEGRVLDERPCGHRPAAVACSSDGRRVAVSNLWAGTLTLLERHGETLRPVATVPVGSQPRGLVFTPDGGSLYVALAGDHEVAHFDWQTRRVLGRWPAPPEPRRLVLTPDGRILAAGCGRSGTVCCWDTRTGRRLWERRIYDAFNLHGLTLSPDGKNLVAAYVHHRHNPITRSHIDHGWALNSRLARLPLEPDATIEYRQTGLDLRGEAVGDPAAVAFSADGNWLVVAAGGTQELLLFQAAAVSWSIGDAGDFLEIDTDPARGKFRRLSLGGRPLAVQFVESERAVVANYLLDAVQVVDVAAGRLVRQVALGGPPRPSPARQGEALFYDARRSHHQWFSCHTCHTDGHTCGRAFDTLNDDSYGNPKQTPSLRGVSRTGPWTWHGRHDDLGRAIEKSFTETLFGPKPSPAEVEAVLAFLQTLDHPPNPRRRPDGSLSPAARRGQELFHGKARCARCHQGEQYTSPHTYDVKLEDDGSPFDRWNPPSLRGVADRGPYLHDGRAETLEELLRFPHAPEKLGGEALTPAERQDLVEFLKSL
ncbi:MAG TPA: cytochrome c peroxidase [Gemmataceae bacterium]|nr:cytochrome c peroxidase [Gemmataceae bacterium]